MTKRFRRIISILTIVLLVPFSSCKKNKVGDLELTFQTQTNSGQTNIPASFTNSSGMDVDVEVFQFYLAEVKLIDDTGSELEIDDIELVQFENTGSYTLTAKSIPVGKYKQIKFGIGVPTAMNEADPTTYSGDDHPLNTTNGTYWGWAAMYRFCSIEGRYDQEPDGTPDGTFAYHSGFEDSYREVIFDISTDIAKKETSQLIFNVNVEEVLFTSGNELDVVNESTFHGDMADIHLSIAMSDNLVSALTVQE